MVDGGHLSSDMHREFIVKRKTSQRTDAALTLNGLLPLGFQVDAQG